MIHAGRNIKGARVNVLGLTFKENVPDIRNSKVIDIIRELHEFGVETFVHDPLASAEDALHEYGVRLRSWEELPGGRRAGPRRGAPAVPRDAAGGAACRRSCASGCLIDVKSVLRRGGVPPRGAARVATVTTPHLVMLGPAAETRGDIAAVLECYRAHGLFGRWSIDYVATRGDGGAWRDAKLL